MELLSGNKKEKIRKKRDRLEIIRDILSFIGEKKREVKPTHILYKTNLSYAMLIEYLTDFIQKGLVEEVRDKKGKKRYRLTSRGYKFIEDFSSIKTFMESYGLE